MEECLAIKPDLVFLWDEAWFAFARFAPSTAPAHRHGDGGEACAQKLRDPAVPARVRRVPARASTPTTRARGWSTRLLPDPDKARVRVYVTHSTHKTLTALRQGSMIHVYDQDFQHKVAERSTRPT